MDAIFAGTLFAKACRTGRWSKGQRGESGIRMLDWDFTLADADLHLEIARSEPLEVVMAPDLFIDTDVTWLLSLAQKLRCYVKRVVIPVHYVNQAVLESGFELAYPLAAEMSRRGDFVGKGFSGWLGAIAGRVTHVLGGAPHHQMRMACYFPNLCSVDGNGLFQAATRYGSFWAGRLVMPFRERMEPRPSCEEAFRRSVANVDRFWREWLGRD